MSLGPLPRVSFLAGYFFMFFWAAQPELCLLVGLWALTVALSRAAMGRHYLGDVCAGLLLGLATSATLGKVCSPVRLLQQCGPAIQAATVACPASDGGWSSGQLDQRTALLGCAGLPATLQPDVGSAFRCQVRASCVHDHTTDAWQWSKLPVV